MTLEIKISIHALLAESDSPPDETVAGGRIVAIHALLAESDSSKDDTFAFVLIISIHALLAESDSIISTESGGIL